VREFGVWGVGGLSLSLKCLITYIELIQSFISLQRHRIRQDGAIFHIVVFWRLRNCPFQQAKKSTTRLDMTQANPTRLKMEFQRALTISQWSKRWSTNSPLFLHIQHQSTTVTCRFLRLSIMRIFPKAANKAKNKILEWALFLQILFQGKGVLSCGARALYKDLTSNNLFLEGNHQSLSSSPGSI
jgi:hypothetical protein